MQMRLHVGTLVLYGASRAALMGNNTGETVASPCYEVLHQQYA